MYTIKTDMVDIGSFRKTKPRCPACWRMVTEEGCLEHKTSVQQMEFRLRLRDQLIFVDPAME